MTTDSDARGPDRPDSRLALVHPELRAWVAQYFEASPAARKPTIAELAAIRQMRSPLLPAPLAQVPYDRRRIADDVPVLIVNACAGASRPAILHMHGGGFTIGSFELMIPTLQALCLDLDCVLVSVDYRLAPEATYRQSTEDTYAALKWLFRNASEIGVDPARIAVMGESAGGGHAALLSIAARDRGEVPVIFQCLTYPMLDDRTGTTREVAPNVGQIVWNADGNRFGWECFLGLPPGGPEVPRAAVPARVEDLAGLPPAFIGVGSLDLFRDENIDYARRLGMAGVSTELIVTPGLFHGFDSITGIPKTAVGQWFKDARLTALKRALSAA